MHAAGRAGADVSPDDGGAAAGARAATAFAPASVSNLACGFDILGMALDAPGDRVTARRAGDGAGPGVVEIEVRGDDGRLPRDPGENSAGAAVSALLESLDRESPEGPPPGIALEVRKGVPVAGGLGSSGASAVAAVVAADRVLSGRRPRARLLRCAIEGERAACGSRHADNVAPSLYGGLVLVRSAREADIVELPVPTGLAVAVMRPHLEVETRMAREALPDRVPVEDAVTQGANLGALVAGLFRDDRELVKRSLVDVIAEPARAPLVPGYRAAKEAALEAGALGANLSGSGPSIFALCGSGAEARSVGKAMQTALEADAGTESDLFVSPASAPGARVERVEESAG